MLKACLRAHGVEPGCFSKKCLNELIEFGVTDTHLMVSTEAEAIEGIAINVAWVCFGESGRTAAEIKAQVDSGDPYGHGFWEILAKNDPKRFALDQLDTTQYVNKLLKAEKNGTIGGR